MRKEFTIDGTRFAQEVGKPDTRGESDAEHFVIVKTDEMLNFYRGLAQHNPRDIMEIGMYEGGSLVWYDKIYKPTRLVGLDLRRTPIAALESYRADKPHIQTYYGRYQEQEGTLAAARQNFPTGIDLVVDDASHLYEQTKETFSMLFPLVRAGGHYVIEDWTWSHRPAYQGPKGVWATQPALTNLVFELTLIASLYGVVASLHIDRGLVCVKKGPGVFRREMFDFSNVLRGKTLQTL